MAVSAPAQPRNPILRVFADLRDERTAPVPYPPGPGDFDMRRTVTFVRDPLSVLMPLYEEHGPIFSVRILHGRVVFMIGPEANHHITVSHADNFEWRSGSFGDLIPLLGDGLLTIDGAYHRRARRIVLPAFHRERIAAAQTTMAEETLRTLDRWRPGDRVDVYHWARELALRVAMRALFGLDPDEQGKGARAAFEFERALSFYGTDLALRLLRGPGSPWRRLQSARATLDRIVYAEIDRRRRDPNPERTDILSLLLDARDADDGSALSDHEVRDQVMTLLFAGHDTTTSTVTFLLYELARHPDALAVLLAEQDDVLQGRAPTAADLTGATLPQLEMALDETLRLYPPAWIGPRKCVETFRFAGREVPGGAYVNYCSWASHRLPEVFPDPDAFVPARFAPEAKARLPKGAYVPFGGGSRICVGMRFGQMEIKTIATLLLQRHRLELDPSHRMTVRQMPTLSPRETLVMTVRDRDAA